MEFVHAALITSDQIVQNQQIVLIIVLIMEIALTERSVEFAIVSLDLLEGIVPRLLARTIALVMDLASLQLMKHLNVYVILDGQEILATHLSLVPTTAVALEIVYQEYVFAKQEELEMIVLHLLPTSCPAILSHNPQ